LLLFHVSLFDGLAY